MLFGKPARTIRRVLIVEDEALVAFDNEHMLVEAGYTVVATVDSVGRALQVIARRPLDLVLVDIVLSDAGSGFDVAKAAYERGIGVLFVSGFCPTEAKAFALGCLAKPYGPRDLIAALEAIEARFAGGTAKRLPRGLSLY